MTDLDTIYKTKLPESHEAGLQAVFDYALEQAAAAFIADQKAEASVAKAPTPDDVVQ